MSSTSCPSVPQVAWHGKHHGEYISIDCKLLNYVIWLYFYLHFLSILINFNSFKKIINVQPSFSQCPEGIVDALGWGSPILSKEVNK